MKYTSYAWFAAIFACLLSGSTHEVFAASDTVPYEKVVHMKSIGVIYALDDILNIKTVGTTVFTNTEDSMSIEDWKLSDAVFDTVSKALGANYKVTRADEKASAFRRTQGRTFRPLDAQLSDLVRFLPDQTIDTYIVIKSYESSDEMVMGPVQGEGIGLSRHNFFEAASAAEFAFVKVYLIDARSGDILARNNLCFGGAYGKCEHKTSQGFNAAYLPTSLINLKEKQKAMLRRDFASFLASGVRGELADMGLIVDMRSQIPIQPLNTVDSER